MAFMKKMLLAVAMLASLTAVQANAAIPITYTGSQTVSPPFGGPITATYSITTDGSLGNINQSNITSYLFTLIQGSNTGQIGSSVEQSYTTGPFFATLTGLSIPTTASNALNFGNGFFLVQFSSYITVMRAGTPDNGFGSFQNNVSFATASTAAVPEPATWAMMLIGFGAIGLAIRRRARARTSLTFA